MPELLTPPDACSPTGSRKTTPLPDGRNFRYYFGQREAIETLVYCYEVMKARSLYKLVQDFCPPDKYVPVDPRIDRFPRYTFKMATGSGKTNRIKVIKRVAYGYRNPANFRQRILLTNQKQAQSKAV